jgi:hypothetical protein
MNLYDVKNSMIERKKLLFRGFSHWKVFGDSNLKFQNKDTKISKIQELVARIAA